MALLGISPAGRAHAGRHVRLARFAGHPMVRLVVRRVPFGVALLFIVTFLSFVLLSLTPGNAAYSILGSSATPEQVADLEKQLGLNEPLPQQYWNWGRDAVTGDLGTSIVLDEPVSSSIERRLPVTISLIVGGLVVMLGIGVPVGILSAVRGGIAGRLLDGVTLVGFALPSFWFAALLIQLFSVKLQLFPAVGYVTPGDSLLDWMRSITLPIVSIALFGIAGFARLTREAMLEVLSSEHVRMAWANGLPPRLILYRYALKNVGMRILTLVGLFTIALLNGTVIIETVFGLPGLGSYVVQGAQQKDLPVVLGCVVLFTLIIVVVNILVDVAYSWLDPRVRAS